MHNEKLYQRKKQIVNQYYRPWIGGENPNFGPRMDYLIKAAQCISEKWPAQDVIMPEDVFDALHFRFESLRLVLERTFPGNQHATAILEACVSNAAEILNALDRETAAPIALFHDLGSHGSNSASGFWPGTSADAFVARVESRIYETANRTILAWNVCTQECIATQCYFLDRALFMIA